MKKMKFQTPLLAASLALAAFMPAHAAPVLDQSQLNDSGSAGFSSGYERSQAFTAGVKGKLSRLDFGLEAMGKTGGLVFSLFAATGGTPKEAALFSLTLSREQLTTGWTQLDLSSQDFFVDAGAQYAFGFKATDVNTSWALNITAGSVDPYAGGAMFGRSPATQTWSLNPNPVTSQLNWDLQFRTWVDPSAVANKVPEPGSLALVLGSLMGLGLVRRRKA